MIKNLKWIEIFSLTKTKLNILGILAATVLVIIFICSADNEEYSNLPFGISFNECLNYHVFEKDGVFKKDVNGRAAYYITSSEKNINGIKADIGMIYQFTSDDRLMSISFVFSGQKNYIDIRKFFIDNLGKPDLEKKEQEKERYIIWKIDNEILFILHTSNMKQSALHMVHFGLFDEPNNEKHEYKFYTPNDKDENL